MRNVEKGQRTDFVLKVLAERFPGLVQGAWIEFVATIESENADVAELLRAIEGLRHVGKDDVICRLRQHVAATRPARRLDDAAIPQTVEQLG